MPDRQGQAQIKSKKQTTFFLCRPVIFAGRKDLVFVFLSRKPNEVKMSLNNILKLGNPILYQVSEEVKPGEIQALKGNIELMHSLILEFRQQYGAGRGIAAPQIGLLKRIICLNLEGKKYTLINPGLSNLSQESMELWDDCMSFPNLLVKVIRHKFCTLSFVDEEWEEHQWNLSDNLSELLQHEYDHLNGILATQRALDDKAFWYKSMDE